MSLISNSTVLDSCKQYLVADSTWDLRDVKKWTEAQENVIYELALKYMACLSIHW